GAAGPVSNARRTVEPADQRTDSRPPGLLASRRQPETGRIVEVTLGLRKSAPGILPAELHLPAKYWWEVFAKICLRRDREFSCVRRFSCRRRTLPVRTSPGRASGLSRKSAM